MFTLSDGLAQIVAQNDYYPFGLRHASDVLSHGSSTDNRYLFNGKEAQVLGRLGLLDYGARMYDPLTGRWFNVDPLAQLYYGISPFAYCNNNPIRFVDWDGRLMDDYYSSLNGKYLGPDGSRTTDMRLIDERQYQEISTKYNGTTSVDASSALQSTSTVISVDETQIQSNLQSVADNSRSSGLEHSVLILLDRQTASVSSVDGPVGTNDKVEIDFYPGSATGASFYGKPGGPIIIGQAHGHPASSDPNKQTQKTMSGNDVNVATSMSIPIYGVDAMNGRVGKPANIHRANPDGSVNNKVGTTQTMNLGQDAMYRWGRSDKPKY